jgi:spore germination cell wall hydrolase CwlJ-like protein
MSFDKQFIPLWVVMAFMILVSIAQEVKASDENGEAFCMAKNIYFEAGNQPVAGKIAVSQVVLNRVYSVSYPDTVCDVVYQAKWKTNWRGEEVPVRHMCQFSWFCDGKSDDPVDSDTWMFSLMVANSVLNGDFGDITEGSTHYHADSVYPYWADSLNRTVTIDNHIFYK